MVYIALIVAVMAGAAALWLRMDSPQSRWWEKEKGIVDERFAFATIPGLALVMTGIFALSMAGLAPEGAGRWLIAGPGAVVLVAGLALSFLGFGRKALPDWLVPAWRRASRGRG